MVFRIEIKENVETIRAYAAQRIEGEPKEWNNYTVMEYTPGNHTIPPVPRYLGMVTHKYSDGADILALKVLELVTKTKKGES